MNDSPWLRVPIDKLEYDNGCYFYDGIIFTGSGYELAPDGSLATEDEFEAGARDGWTRSWNADGRLVHEGQIYAGRSHGIQRRWHDNGRLASEDHDQFGVTLTHKAWDEQGNLIESEAIDKAGEDYQEVLKIRALYG
jgi:antitoxin component YwqK of YwqJK toxin-antitoxin module